MALSSPSSKIVYVGDETSTNFSYPFKIFADTDLTVSRYTPATYVTDLFVLNVNYTVTGAGNDAGGFVILSEGHTAVHTGSQLVIQRVMDLTQEVDYVENDPFPAETLEEALDKNVMICQQLQEQVDRCIKADITQTTGSTTYTEVVNDALSAAQSSATVAVDAGTAAASSATVCVASATNAAASAVQASESAASVSSGVTAALDNLTPTAVNESLLPGSSDYITLGNATKKWQAISVSRTSNMVTVIGTLFTGTSLNVSGTSNVITLTGTLLSAATLNISGTSNAVTLAATLITATTLRVSGTTNAITLNTTLLSATSLNVSGTINATNISGDGSLLTGTGSLGAWVDKSADYGAQEAAADGFVVATCRGTAGAGEFYIYTDANADPTTLRARHYCVSASAYDTVTCPVKKGDSWKVVLNAATVIAIYWIPLGS